MTELVQKNTTYNASFGGLLLMLFDFVNYLLSRWKIISLSVLIGGLIGFFIVFKSSPTYIAKLTFMVNEEKASSNGIESILGTLGVSSGGSSQHNLPKILELSSSMKILQEVLMKTDTIDGKIDLFANHFIRVYNFHNKWTGNKKNFFYQKTNIASFDLVENEVLKILYHHIVGTEKTDGIFTKALSSDSRIMTLSLDTPSEDLSVEMLQAIFTELSEYYVDKTIEKQKSTFLAIQLEADSIQKILKTTE